MNTFMNNLAGATNYKLTENGGVAHSSTLDAVYDMFAFGGAYRTRSDADCITLFKSAFAEDPSMALKCLFYLRDVRGGQGERRFFRVCMNWLANENSEAAARNLPLIAEYGRYDDLYLFVDTPLQSDMFEFMHKQLLLDINSYRHNKAVSLLAKWLKSENTSSEQSRKLGTLTRIAFGMTPREYRKTLSMLREHIKVLERLMSENRWDEIEFDSIPSRAGVIYRNAFARRDMIKEKYEKFANDENTTVNADTLYPYDIISKATAGMGWYGNSSSLSNTERKMIEKYWYNQKDYLNGKDCSMICVVDTSGSMTGDKASAPINVAIGLGMYCAERLSGPFKNKYISFSSRPQLIDVSKGTDFVDRVQRIYKTNLCENTDLCATFELLRRTALKSKPEDCPKTVVVISDMEIDSMSGGYSCDYATRWTQENASTEMEKMRSKWEASGLTMPKLVYWNVEARQNTILDAGPNVSFVSGCSPVIFEQVISGVTGKELMLQKLNSERYAAIH